MAKRIQVCFNCGEECGIFDNYLRELITCGKRECEKEASYQRRCEEEEIRERAAQDKYDRYR